MTEPTPTPADQARISGPPAIALGEPDTTRRLRALRKGEAHGWWTILPSRNPDVMPNKIVFRVRLANGTVRNIGATKVLSWCLGQADARGHGHEFTFEAGQ